MKQFGGVLKKDNYYKCDVCDASLYDRPFFERVPPDAILPKRPTLFPSDIPIERGVYCPNCNKFVVIFSQQ